MLTVAKVTASQAAGYADYLDGRAQLGELGDYYLKDGERVEAPGRWVTTATPVAPVTSASPTSNIPSQPKAAPPTPPTSSSASTQPKKAHT